MRWKEGEYTFYGVQTLSYTAASQPPGSMTCWSYALGAILGVPWSTVALHSDLGGVIEGQSTVGVRELYLALNKSAEQNRWGRLRELARWYAVEWHPDQLEEYFPQALAITGHFVVALAIGRAASKPEKIRYWDPGDAQIHVELLKEFALNYRPEFGVIKVR